MRIILLADINSTHIKRWATSLAERKVEVGIYSLSVPSENWYERYGIRLLSPAHETSVPKWRYFLYAKNLKASIALFKPDIVHAHYATSYGLLLRRSGFHPGILSVWGSDVFVFPKKYFFGRFLLRRNLNYPDCIQATGIVLKNETNKYIDRPVSVIAFGVDTVFFKPADNKDDSKVDISIAKSLEKTYGIDLLIDVFYELKKTHKNIFLNIAGDGTMKETYIRKVKELELNHSVSFMGQLTREQVAELYASSDIAVFLSVTESFGVSVIEASACGVAVVCSSVGGHKEVVKNEETGYLVDRNQKQEIIEKLNNLIENKALRQTMGAAGRKFVIEKFEWKKCVDEQLEVYSALLNKK
ncbi:MAG: glycosyltransferase [Flavobacteriales bacterium]